LHYEKLYDLNSSTELNWVFTSRRIKWAWHVARIGKKEVLTGLGWVNMAERDGLEIVSLNRKIILKWIYERGWDMFQVMEDAEGDL
jgi:hypothetical protein